MGTNYKGYYLPEHGEKNWADVVLTLFRDTIDTIAETDAHRVEYEALFTQTLNNIQSTNMKDFLVEVDALFGDNDDLKNEVFQSFNQSFTNLTSTNFSELLNEIDTLMIPNMGLFDRYAIVDVFESTDGSVIYAGYQDENNDWLIKYVTIVGSVTTVRYATKLHAPSGSAFENYTYTQAWTNKETITYVDITTLYTQ